MLIIVAAVVLIIVAAVVLKVAAVVLKVAAVVLKKEHRPLEFVVRGQCTIKTTQNTHTNKATHLHASTREG